MKHSTRINIDDVKSLLDEVGILVSADRDGCRSYDLDKHSYASVELHIPRKSAEFYAKMPGSKINYSLFADDSDSSSFASLEKVITAYRNGSLYSIQRLKKRFFGNRTIVRLVIKDNGSFFDAVTHERYGDDDIFEHVMPSSDTDQT